jgi:hypothetical protein
MAHELAGETVADSLRAEATRAATLDALEALAPPISRDLASGAAPGLVDVAACTEVREELDRCALLFARLLAEAAPDPSAVWGSGLAGDRLAAYLAPRLVLDAAQRALASCGNGDTAEGGQELTMEDARSYACRSTLWPYGMYRGFNPLEAAAERTMMDYLKIVRASTRPPAVHV